MCKIVAGMADNEELLDHKQVQIGVLRHDFIGFVYSFRQK